MPITLSTGRVVESHGAGGDVFGISEDLNVSEGYDIGWLVDGPKMSAAEMAEFCLIMAERWTRLAARYIPPAM